MWIHGIIVLVALTGSPDTTKEPTDISQGNPNNPTLLSMYEEVANPQGFTKIHCIKKKKLYKELK